MAASQAHEMLRAASVRVARVVPVLPSGYLREEREKERSWHLQGSPSGKFPGRQSSFRSPPGTSVTSPPFLLHGLLWCCNCHTNYQASLMPEDFFSQPLKTELNVTILLLQTEKRRHRGSEGRLGSTSQAVNPRCPDFFSPR